MRSTCRFDERPRNPRGTAFTETELPNARGFTRTIDRGCDRPRRRTGKDAQKNLPELLGSLMANAPREDSVAIEHFERSLRLSPTDHVYNRRSGIGWGHFLEGRYEEAVRWADAALQEQPRWVSDAKSVSRRSSDRGPYPQSSPTLDVRTVWLTSIDGPGLERDIRPAFFASSPEIYVNRFPRLLGQFESDRTPSLFLPHGCAINGDAVWRYVLNLEGHDIAPAELAIDRKIEHGEVTNTSIKLQFAADGPNMFWP